MFSCLSSLIQASFTCAASQYPGYWSEGFVDILRSRRGHLSLIQQNLLCFKESGLLSTYTRVLFSLAGS